MSWFAEDRERSERAEVRLGETMSQWIRVSVSRALRSYS